MIGVVIAWILKLVKKLYLIYRFQLNKLTTSYFFNSNHLSMNLIFFFKKFSIYFVKTGHVPKNWSLSGNVARNNGYSNIRLVEILARVEGISTCVRPSNS